MSLFFFNCFYSNWCISFSIKFLHTYIHSLIKESQSMRWNTKKTSELFSPARMIFPQTSARLTSLLKCPLPQPLFKPTITTPSAKSWPSLSPFPAPFFLHSTYYHQQHVCTPLFIVCFLPPKCFSRNKRMFSIVLFNAASSALRTLCETR